MMGAAPLKELEGEDTREQCKFCLAEVASPGTMAPFCCDARKRLVMKVNASTELPLAPVRAERGSSWE